MTSCFRRVGHRRSSSARLLAFTLIELLAVVSIIAVLVALLMPALGRARDIANTAACASNLRQIGVGVRAYTAQYNGRIPPTLSSVRAESMFGNAGVWGKTEYFRGKMVGYYNYRWRILRCPAEYTTPRLNPLMKDITYYDCEFTSSSYFMNWSVSHYLYYPGYCWCVTPGSDWTANPCCNPYPMRRMGPPDLVQPIAYDYIKQQYFTENITAATAPFWMDLEDVLPSGIGWAYSYFGWELDNPYSWTNSVPTNPGNPIAYAFRHQGKANVLYLDGHVEAKWPKWKTGENVYHWIWVNPPAAYEIPGS